jgi:hypothetical protein
VAMAGYEWLPPSCNRGIRRVARYCVISACTPIDEKDLLNDRLPVTIAT